LIRGAEALKTYQSEIKLTCEGLNRMEKRYSEIDSKFSKPLIKQARKVIKNLSHIRLRLEETGGGCRLLVEEIEKSLATPLLQCVASLKNTFPMEEEKHV
jgi:hypothetical protein